MRIRLLVVVLTAFCSTLINAQSKPATIVSDLCTKENAVEATKQQLLSSRTFDNAVGRIAVVLRYADLMWPHDREPARAAFLEAFELASQNFKETGDQIKRYSESKFSAVTAVPDQRYKVITAYAKRDSEAARKLAEQMLEAESKEAQEKPTTDQQQRKTAEKIFSAASELVATDQKSAVDLARAGLRYPAVMYLPMFIFSLAKANESAADQFYQEALAAYSTTPMNQFLYLSAYPFGNTRDAGEMPGYTFYRIPEGFTPNVALQRLFVQRLIAKVEAGLQTPVTEPAGPNYQITDSGNMWLALSRLEKQIADNLPDLVDPAVQAKEKLYSVLNPSLQSRVGSTLSRDNPTKRSFDEVIETALKNNTKQRDMMLSAAVQSVSKDEPMEKVINAIEKISDENVRPALLNWFYFRRIQSLISDKLFEEARGLSTKIREVDQRAFLSILLVEAWMKQTEDQTLPREIMNETSTAIGKAPKTIVAARAGLALAYLYAKVDPNRGIEELGNAVKIINALENPDFSQEFVMLKIEGKDFASFASFATPGFNPQKTFSEIGKIDFDGSLNQASTLTDKSLRSLTMLSVIEPCLMISPKAKPSTKKKL